MTDIMPNPPIYRVLAAFATAPVVPTFLYACSGHFSGGLADVFSLIFQNFAMVVLFGAYPLTIMVGMPAYELLRSRLCPTPLNCALVGAMVAALPSLIFGVLGVSRLYLFALFLSFPMFGFSEDGDGHVIMQNGDLTLWAWYAFAKITGIVALLGALGGLVFWTVAAAGLKRPAAAR